MLQDKKDGNDNYYYTLNKVKRWFYYGPERNDLCARYTGHVQRL